MMMNKFLSQKEIKHILSRKNRRMVKKEGKQEVCQFLIDQQADIVEAEEVRLEILAQMNEIQTDESDMGGCDQEVEYNYLHDYGLEDDSYNEKRVEDISAEENKAMADWYYDF